MEIHQLKCDHCGKIEIISDKNTYLGGSSMKWRLIETQPWPNGIKDYCSDSCLRAAILAEATGHQPTAAASHA